MPGHPSRISVPSSSAIFFYRALRHELNHHCHLRFASLRLSSTLFLLVYWRGKEAKRVDKLAKATAQRAMHMYMSSKRMAACSLSPSLFSASCS